jgi:type I restriction enzyme S subunit
MGSEWREYRLADLGSIVTGRTPPASRPDDFGDSLPFLTPTDMDGRRKMGPTARSLSREGARAMERAVVPGGVAVSCIGWQMGKTVLVDRPALTNQQINTIVPDETRVDPLFLYYTLSAKRSQIFALGAGGSRTPILNKSDFGKIPLVMPHLTEQRRIAGILGALDDKIELNRRMSQTLESMARALFKSWFVDYDPVRAKSQGRDPGWSASLADLFPRELEDSEAGPVPAGWSISTIDQELTAVLGGTPARAEPRNWVGGTIPWINSGKVNEFRIVEPSEFITEAGLAASSTKMLPAGTTVVAITGATLGQVSRLEIDACANQSIVGVLSSDSIPDDFVYPWIKHNIDSLVARQTGAAQQHVNRNDVGAMGLLIPTPNVLAAYVRHVGPIFDRVGAISLESIALAETRDSCLVQLIQPGGH